MIDICSNELISIDMKLIIAKSHILTFRLPRGWYPTPTVFLISHFLHLE